MTLSPMRKNSTRFGVFGAAIALVAATGTVGSFAAAGSQASPVNDVRSTISSNSAATKQASVRITGEVGKAGKLTPAALRTFKQRTLTSSFLTSKGPQKHTYTGVLLLDILNAAAPNFDPADRHDPLRFAVLVRATDGFEAVYAFSELVADLANTKVLLATMQDGEVLARPRMAVPSDSHGARYVYDIAEIKLVRVAGRTPAHSGH